MKKKAKRKQLSETAAASIIAKGPGSARRFEAGEYPSEGKARLADIPLEDNVPRLRKEDQNNEVPVNSTDRDNLEAQNNEMARKYLEDERIKREMRIRESIESIK